MKKQRLQELAGLKEFQQNTDTQELVSRMEGMADKNDSKSVSSKLYYTRYH